MTVRKQRMIVFGMVEKVDNTDREQVLYMVERLGANVSEEAVCDVTRTRCMDRNDRTVRSVIVNFKSKHENWQVLKNKSDMKEIADLKKVCFIRE